jgi:hypothetical protein
MKYQLLLKILQVLCLGTTMHGFGLGSLDRATAQTPTSESAQPITTPPIAQPPVVPPATSAPTVVPTAAAAPIQPVPVEPTTPATATPVPVAPDKTGSTVKILAPTPNLLLDIPATIVVIQYKVGTTIELKVGDRIVDKNLIGRTETDATTNLITQTWYGVSLTPGKNILTATSSQGEVTTTTIQVAGAATKIQLSTAETRVPADGRSLVNIEGQLLDENNNLSKQDSVVTISATAGEFAGIDLSKDQPGFQVPVQKGKFTAKLRTGLDAQTVRIRATNLNMEAYAQVQFETNLRTSIATGVFDVRLGARGTDYYRPFSEFLPVDRNNSSQIQARGQVFATGRIGDWSATGAFNSDRALNKGCNGADRLSRDTSSQPCEELYPLYGDSSKVDVLTPSRDSVYAKLERSTGVAGSIPDMIMWGDYATNEFAARSQQFTATNRNLHGAKINYNVGNLAVSGFYGDNIQGFQRDNIAPDGTSGTYFLSQRLLLGGSENLTIESEELNRPGTVIKQEILNRGLDYEIDYDRGTVLLRQPLLRTSVNEDGTILVRRLVATYQYANGSNNSIYGSRAQYNIDRTSGRESWLGASWMKENLGIRNFSIVGADALIPIGNGSNLTAEFARSTNNPGLGIPSVDGNAVRVEGQYKFNDATTGRSYFRSTEAGFANNSTTSFVPGQTRYGADLSTKLGDRTTIRAQFDREENRGKPPLVNNNLIDLLTPRDPLTGLVDNDLRTITVGVQQRIGVTNVDLDYVNRNRQDRLALDPLQRDVSSDQIRSRVNWPLTTNLTLRAQNEINLSNQQDQVYPNRSVLGLDWNVYPGIKLGLNQNFISSNQYGDTSYTSLDFDSVYNLSSSTKLTGRYSLSPFQSIGSAGIQQGIVLSPGLKLDLNYERVLGGNTSATTGAGQQFAQPYSLGQTASSLGTTTGDSYGIGINYTDNPNFQANARYEYRNSNLTSTSNINAGLTGKLSPALTALLRFQQSSAANQVIRDAGLGARVDVKAGLAFRNPASDEFNGLFSYQYRRNPSILPTSILTTSGAGSEDHTLALEGIYAPNWQWEYAGKYALRNATSYLDQSLTAGETIGISQLRATYRLAHDWDLTGDVRWLNQFSSGRSEVGAAIEAGYYITPDLRLSAGYSLGAADDPNRRNASGAYLGVTVKINELFGGFGRQQSNPVQQQESQVVTPIAPPAQVVPATPAVTAPTVAPATPITPATQSPTPAQPAVLMPTTVPVVAPILNPDSSQKPAQPPTPTQQPTRIQPQESPAK